MTLIEAINGAGVLRRNSGYSQDDMTRWLSQLDGMVKAEILDKFEGAESIEYNGYDANTPENTVLLIPHPYDMVYLHWLAMQIDYANQEASYVASQTMFNTAYVAFERWYFSAHKPKQIQYKYY